MTNPNLYWPIYKNLEREVLDLANNIHFTDCQRGVYSIHIADLIIRSSTELESLAKDIYRQEVGNDPVKPGDCFDWLDEQWHISKKQVVITTQYFYFIQSYKPAFAPFDYNSTEDKNIDDYSERKDFYSMYNSIKHDRIKNINKANINILIRVMAALYLLNIYFKNQSIPIANTGFTGENIPEILNLDAKLFGVRVFHTPRDKIYDEIEKCAYYVCNTQEFAAIKEISKRKEKNLALEGIDLGYPPLTINEVEALISRFPHLKDMVDVDFDIDILMATFPNRIHLELNRKTWKSNNLASSNVP